MTRAVTEKQRQQVIELKRKHSHNAVARMTGLPLGTVRTIVRRSGLFTDNPVHAELFTLPPIQHSASTGIESVALPEQKVVTGDREIDAMLWLRELVNTGSPALIDKALEAGERIKTPPDELELRYTAYLAKHSNGNPFATFASFDFANLDKLAQRSKEKAMLKSEAAARFGDDPDLMTEAERFCIRALDGICTDALIMSSEQVAERFNEHPDVLPHTLADCLRELEFWNRLYWLADAAGAGEPAQETSAREWFTFGLMAKIRPRSKAEAKAVLTYLLQDDRKGDSSADAILENLLS